MAKTTRKRRRPRADQRLKRELPERLRDLMKERFGGVQRRFARALNVEATQVSKWIKGAQLPSASQLARIAEVSGWSVDWLLLGNGAKRRDGVKSRWRAHAEAGY